MIETLKQFLADLKNLRRDIKADKVDRIAKKALRSRAEEIGSRWFAEISPRLTQQLGISEDILDKYNTAHARLIRLSSPNNLKKSYLESLDAVVKPFQDEIIMPARKGSSMSPSRVLLCNILETLPDPTENEYLREAVSCAQRGFSRASVILGWSAAIDRIHRKIEAVGFAKFNVTSAQMVGQKKGRFKRFSSPQNITSRGELAEVFDTVVLWVIEGMGMIECNQHTRLRSCFDMRCQCAHPGEAPVTEYNLMSFFSDLNEIVFQNPMFTI